MARITLITSFDRWESHHTSNSSDDLLAAMIQRNLVAEHIYFLRKIPVDFQLAPKVAIAKINELKPDQIICCGMAEKRTELTIESNGKSEEEMIQTTIKLDQIISHLSLTKISHDAGNFVCNHLYYSILKHIQINQLNSHCIFIHVPLLNETNLFPILKDFHQILQTIQLA
jgi:pyroglutamyl-peptidase